mgnify:CR=1 FL=1
MQRKGRRQSRQNLLNRVCGLAGITRRRQTVGYFSRQQLLELVAFMERVSEHGTSRSERN